MGWTDLVRRKEPTVQLEPGEPVTQTPEELALGMREIYNALDVGVSNLSHGDSVGEVVGDNLLGWLGTGRYKTDREHLCRQFSQDVQTQVAKLQIAMESAPPEDSASACALVAQVMLVPVPSQSNETEDLMRRAMAARIQPLLPYMDKALLKTYCDQIKTAYPKRMRFPAERDLIKEMERLLKG